MTWSDLLPAATRDQRETRWIRVFSLIVIRLNTRILRDPTNTHSHQKVGHSHDAARAGSETGLSEGLGSTGTPSLLGATLPLGKAASSCDLSTRGTFTTEDKAGAGSGGGNKPYRRDFPRRGRWQQQWR